MSEYKAKVEEIRGIVTQTYDSGKEIEVELSGGFVSIKVNGSHVAHISVRQAERENIDNLTDLE